MHERPATISCFFFVEYREWNRVKKKKKEKQQKNCIGTTDRAQDVGQISDVPFIGPCSEIRASIKDWEEPQSKCAVLPRCGKGTDILWLLIKQDAVSLGAVMLAEI